MVHRDPIADLVHRYADGVVHRDSERWLATWATNGVWDLGGGRVFAGHDELLGFFDLAMSGLDAVIQTVLNGTHRLDPSEDSGGGRWYIQELMVQAEGGPALMVGHYDDRYVLEDGVWRFASRALSTHYMGPPDLSGRFTAVADRLD